MRPATLLARSLAGLYATMFVAVVALTLLSLPAGAARPSGIVGDYLLFVPFTPFPIVGALIASRRPRNPVGWICLADGLLWMLIILGQEYSSYGLSHPGSVPFPVTINALLYSWLWVPAVGLLGTFLLLLFPDGRLPSRRWRPLAFLSGTVIVLVSILAFLTPGPLEGLGGARNPFGLEGQPWVVAAGWIVLPLLPLCLVVPLCLVASAASLVVRFRHSSGEVRQQIKWIAFAASFMGLVYLSIMGASAIAWLISPEAPIDPGKQSLWGAVLENVMLISFASIPTAIGFAVLQYRLYEIDLIINRTLVYGSLTLMLVVLYFGGVTATQTTLQAFTGQNDLPQIAVVASTLVIAALFNPLRRRLQVFIDQRFYRRKYDAARTLEEFSAQLRDESDLERLRGEPVRGVRDTVQPEHVTLWLRKSVESR